MGDKWWVYRPVLDLLGISEGTDKGRGYNETLDYGAYTGGDVDLLSMTLDQIDDLQTAMLQHPKNKWNSSAIGRYQIVRKTLRALRAQNPRTFNGNVLFSKDTQDYLAVLLMRGRGMDRYLDGQKSLTAMMNDMALEWASWPKPNGKGAYEGQNAGVSVNRATAILMEAKRRWNSPEEYKAQLGVKVDPAPVHPHIPQDGKSETPGLWERIKAWFFSLFN